MDKVLNKVVTMGIAAGGGFVATKAFEFVWQKATGESAPVDVNSDEIPLQRALVFAVSSAAISAAVQVLSQRGAKSTVRRIRGGYGTNSEV